LLKHLAMFTSNILPPATANTTCFVALQGTVGFCIFWFEALRLVGLCSG